MRADIVERLADLIRATFNSPTRAPQKTGFEITTQMTSLTGCSGDDFASILRSLGFESEEIDYGDQQRQSDIPGEATRRSECCGTILRWSESRRGRS